jgi:hypothetical protein
MRYWLGVVSKEHVLKGVAGNFAQVCHGKKGPLSKMKKGDWLIYYSPGDKMGESNLKAFTAIGKISDDEIFQFKMALNFIPFRRKIDYLGGYLELPLSTIKSRLELCKESSWGYKLRRGLIELSESDFALIKKAMEQ